MEIPAHLTKCLTDSMPRETKRWITWENLENGGESLEDIMGLYENLHAADETISNLLDDQNKGRLTIDQHRELALAYREILDRHMSYNSVCSWETIVKEIHRVFADYVKMVFEKLLPDLKTDEDDLYIYHWTMIASFHHLVLSNPNFTGNYCTSEAHKHPAEHCYKTAALRIHTKLLPINPIRLTFAYSYAHFLKEERPEAERPPCRTIVHAIIAANDYVLSNNVNREQVPLKSRQEISKLKKQLELWNGPPLDIAPSLKE